MKPWSQTQTTKVIILKSEPLTAAEITSAFKGNEGTQWWKALSQVINEWREENADSAASFAKDNNALAMAHDNGAHSVLTRLLSYLSSEVKGD
jgi:hypothetical protein